MTAPSRSCQPQNKAQRRPNKAKAKASVADKKVCKDPSRGMPLSTPAQTPAPAQQAADREGSLSLLSEIVQLDGWDSAWELDGWSWGAVDEEKLLGWLPFAEEDFHCFCAENRGASSGFLWEDYHDIWRLKHVYEIPSSANR
ncbi:hypothetical protein HPP92_000214 [Vanilla planifolia]|uniref:Uncharacterized protein n=1 Tax=Vanilla planifolia TaxID=51239 RepID=A0A835S9R7_VANPL|nr:hypothetical protein HPP92_000214 [Vanilla planifolia]